MATLGQTKLDAVNACLLAINEYRVTALDTGGTSIQADAGRVVDESTRYFCAIGYPCNTRNCVAISATLGIITVPAATLRIKPAGASAYRNLVLRGDKVYDADQGTGTFGSTETVFLDIAELLDFEDCDPMLKEEISQHAAQRFARRRIGSQVTDTFLSQELQITDSVNPKQNKFSINRIENNFDKPNTLK